MRIRLALSLVALVGSAAAFIGIDVRASYGARVTADEPQYLLTAISLAEDLSLDIADEIADQRYLPFHEIGLNRQTEPLKDGREVSPHDPLLPVLLAVPMELGGTDAAKSSLALMNGALAATMLWVAVRRFGARLVRSAILVAFFAASAPFAVYGNQVYPELPAALVVALGTVALTAPRTAASLSAVAVAVTALPWLSIKYAPVAAALAGVALWRMWRAGERKRALIFVGSLTVMGVAYLVAHQAWYGGWTVYSTGDHFQQSGEFSVVGTNVNPLGRSRRLIGLMIDDKFGLAAWQPAFSFAFPALGALVACRHRWRPELLVPIAAGWLNATFVALTMQGWWWPGRQVVVILPLVVVPLVWWATASRSRFGVAVALASVGVVAYLWIVIEGLRGDLTWVVDFFETSNPLYRAWRSVLPDYLDVTASTWALQAAWVLVAAIGILWGVRTATRTREGSEPSLT